MARGHPGRRRGAEFMDLWPGYSQLEDSAPHIHFCMDQEQEKKSFL